MISTTKTMTTTTMITTAAATTNNNYTSNDNNDHNDEKDQGLNPKQSWRGLVGKKTHLRTGIWTESETSDQK